MLVGGVIFVFGSHLAGLYYINKKLPKFKFHKFTRTLPLFTNQIPEDSYPLSLTELIISKSIGIETRIVEDFDEFCDPENPRKLTYEDSVEAAEHIKPHIQYTPCVPSYFKKDFGIGIYYKCEFLQRTGSFKERGSYNVLRKLTSDKQKIGVVAASLGNQAMGLCYHGNRMGIPVTIVVPLSVSIAKIQHCVSFGAKVIKQGNNLSEAHKFARSLAKEKGLTYINGRDHPHVLSGYGTMALEILDQLPSLDAVLVPVGSGGLIAAVATIIKHVKPNCLIYGVQPVTVNGFFKSLEEGEPLTVPLGNSLADSLAITKVGVNSFYNAAPLIDKMLLVSEDWVARAILHLVDEEKMIVEGAGACTVAALIGSLVPELKTKNVVCILSGGNIDASLLGRCLDRGLAAEGRLVKFKVNINNSTAALSQILALIRKGGYNLVRQFIDHVWVEGDVFTNELKLVVETRDMHHGIELKRIIEKAYPNLSAFETEPFNDRRTCPCYVPKLKKTM